MHGYCQPCLYASTATRVSDGNWPWFLYCIVFPFCCCCEYSRSVDDAPEVCFCTPPMLRTFSLMHMSPLSRHRRNGLQCPRAEATVHEQTFEFPLYTASDPTHVLENHQAAQSACPSVLMAHHSCLCILRIPDATVQLPRHVDADLHWEQRKHLRDKYSLEAAPCADWIIALFWYAVLHFGNITVPSQKEQQACGCRIACRR